MAKRSVKASPAMNMPGFAAEASLYHTTQLYSVKTSYGNATGAVVPQRMKLTTVHCDCDGATDICVCDNGRVLSMTLGEL
jgi:hypothetical protein